MDRFSKSITLLILAIGLFVITGCSKYAGKWAYNHDPETVILELDQKGNAIYKGQKYKYKEKEPFFELKDENGNVINLRFRKEDGKLYIYEKSVYDYQGNGHAERLPGYWKSGNSSFEFTPEGKFMEDGVFTGVYSVDPENMTFTLKYNESFADTECYYSIENDQLRLEYPWCLVKAK